MTDKINPINNTVCPQIKLYVNNVPVNALVDTGSEVTIINSAWVKIHNAHFKNVPKLPTREIQITTANKSMEKVNHQMYVSITCQGLEIELPVLIVDKLIYDCILGVDALDRLNAVINMKDGQMTCTVNNICITIDLRAPVKEQNPPQPEILKISRPKITLAEERIHPEEVEDQPGEQHINDLLGEYEDIFSEVPTQTHVYQHRIKVTDPSKFVRRTYTIPMKYEEQVDQEIQRMLDNNVIRRSHSNYLNPLVVIKKKDDAIRLCMDMRNLNNVVEKMYDCAPNAEELFAKCEGARYLTKLDLTSSFWQIPIRESDRKYTAFLYKNKTYEYNVVPFGLSTSLSAIVRCLENALGEEVSPYTMVFVDDILVVSKTIQEHVNQLRVIFEKFRVAKISLNYKKCEFLKTNIKFLGHIISERGIKPDPIKIQSILNFPIPKNVKGVRAFLGLTGYYRRFSSDYAATVKPLLELTQKKRKWRWEQHHTEAVDRVKTLFKQNLMLHHPKKDGDYVLYADASQYAMGSVLYQKDSKGDLRVIAYASRVFRGAEIEYCTTEKEVLAIVYALSQFRFYLCGTHFEIHTDHQALSFLLTCKVKSARLMRWILAIGEYSFTIKYCKGKDNEVADTLSRYIEEKEETHEAKPQDVRVLSNITYKPEREVQELLRNLAREQDKDQRLQNMKNNPLPINYCVKDGILFKLINYDWKVVLSHDMLQQLIMPCHRSLAHASPLKCYLTMKEAFTCNNMFRKIKIIVRKCHDCQTAKHPNLNTCVEMGSIRTKKKGDIVALDFLGPLPRSSRGYRHIIVTVDVFTKLVKLYAVRRPTMKSVLNVITQKYIPKYGKMDKVLTDQGKQFGNKLWKDALTRQGIKPVLTSIRHPQTNLAERINRELGKYMRLYCYNQQSKWPDYLQFFEDAMNHNYSEATGYTPLELSENKIPKRFWHNMINKPENYNVDLPIQIKINRAERQLYHQAGKRRDRYNRTHRLTRFQIGDKVLIKTNPVGSSILNTSKKFFRLFCGPYELRSRLGPHTYMVYDPVKQKDVGKYHASSLRHYIQ